MASYHDGKFTVYSNSVRGQSQTLDLVRYEAALGFHGEFRGKPCAILFQFESDQWVADGVFAAAVPASSCGMISMASIAGFSILLVKVILNVPLVTSTGTVST